MSLYLISKDSKLRLAMNRQLETGCHWAGSFDYLKRMARLIERDSCPVILIDETFHDRGHLPVLEVVISSRLPGSKILLTSKHGNTKNKTLLYDNGFGILQKPFSLDQLIKDLVRIGRTAAIIPHLTEDQRDKLHRDLDVDPYGAELVGKSQSMVLVRSIIKKIGNSFASVHINGETGTGKEVVSTLLRRASGTPDPYVVMNCSSIPTSLADTYIFGNQRGAYTDAKEPREGIIKSADGGILFLDEIEDLSPVVQGKFLRLLETRQFRQVGSDRIEYSDFKLITASNIPLEELSKNGTLRFDLYNRLNRLVINLPPLREHKEDIPLLINHYLASIGEDRKPDTETTARIMQYGWPGNVRELFKELDLLAVFAPHEAKSLSWREILTETVLTERQIEATLLKVSEPPQVLHI